MIGTTLLQYEIIEQLGEGGMGVVYKAKDTKLDRFVALKFLTKQVGATEADRLRFLQEAKASATLNHPNICTVYDVVEHEGQLFIAMEYLEGETLRDRKNNISLKQAIDIGIQIAEGLAAAHEKGVVHRDIKPENIMLRKDGLVQIMDFGLAKLQGVSKLTREGNTVGTLGYMSPEQIQGFDVDHRSDIFSFGVLLYELISGQSPFKGVHETAIIYEIVNVDPEPISLLKPELSPDLDAVLLECLAKEKDERYQSAKEIVKDLRKLKRESSRQTASRILAVRKSQIASGSRMAPKTTEYETVPAPRSSSALIWKIISGVFIVLFSGSLVWFLFLSTPDTELVQLSFEVPPGHNFNTAVGGHIEISPDGRTVAYVAIDSLGKSNLWVRPLQSGTSIMLAGTENAYYPFWSYDSRMIVFFADGKMKKIDAKGGPTFSITNAPNGRGGSWSNNGVIVFAPNSNGPLHQVSSAGGESKQLTTLDTTELEVNHRWPVFLPDGEHFFYSVQTSKATLDDEAEHIRIGSLSQGNGKVIVRATTNVLYNDGWVLYYKQSTLLAQRFKESALEFSGEPIPVLENLLFAQVRSKGAFSLSHNDRLVYLEMAKSNVEYVMYGDGKPLHKKSRKFESFTSNFSNDNKFYAWDNYDESAKNSDIWIYDIARNSDIRLTFGKSQDIIPLWSHDDQKIFFSSNKEGQFALYAKNSNGTGDEQLVFKNEQYPSFATDITADGKKLLVSYNTQGPQKWNLGIFSLQENKFTPLLTTEFNEWVGSFSPDGKWFAYQSDETGRYEIYIRPTDGSASKWQVSTGGGGGAQWGKNGREIFFNSGNNSISSASVIMQGDQITIGSITKIFSADAGFQTKIQAVSSDGKQVLISRMLNTQTLKSASLIFNWNKIVEQK